MKKHISYIIILLFILQTNYIHGQQEQLQSQYHSNKLIINPAYAGTTRGGTFILSRRDQWINIEGAPQTNSLTYHSPINRTTLGAGGSIICEKNGPISVMNASFNLASKLEVQPKHYVSIGVKTSFDYRKTNISELDPYDNNDPAYNSDPIKGIYPNIGVGVYYYSRDYYFGLSIPKINKSKVENKKSSHSLKEQLERHYYVMAGYDYKVNDVFKLSPSLLIRKVKAAPASVDLGVTGNYNDVLKIGITSRFGDAFASFLQLKVVQGLWIGYSFDLSVSELSAYNSGTHEIMAKYNLRWRKKTALPWAYRY